MGGRGVASRSGAYTCILRLVGFCPNPEISTSEAALAGPAPNKVAAATSVAAILAAREIPFAMFLSPFVEVPSRPEFSALRQPAEYGFCEPAASLSRFTY